MGNPNRKLNLMVGLEYVEIFKVTLNPVMSVDQYPLPKSQDLYSRVKISDFVTNLWLTKFDVFLLYFRVFVTK